MSDGLVEIRPPQAPPDGPPVGTALLLLLLVAALAILSRRLYGAPRRRARRGLRRLRAAVHAGRLEPRAAAHALAGLLRSGLAAELSEDPAAGTFAGRLTAARFAPAACDAEELEALLAEAAWRLRETP